MSYGFTKKPTPEATSFSTHKILTWKKKCALITTMLLLSFAKAYLIRKTTEAGLFILHRTLDECVPWRLAHLEFKR